MTMFVLRKGRVEKIAREVKAEVLTNCDKECSPESLRWLYVIGLRDYVFFLRPLKN